MAAVGAVAQVETGGPVRRRTEKDRRAAQQTGGNVTDRMQSFFEKKKTNDADLVYQRDIWRQIDLSKDVNAPLYFPEDVVDGQENLFRLILRLVTEGKIPAYEYLDGREVFSDKYKVNVGDMLDRFNIYYQKAKNSTDKNPRYTIEEADVPTNQVLNYYIIEKWEFDKRSNRMRTYVEAICPVLNRVGDFGGETKYPMFWVKFDALRPYLAANYVFLSDDNNLAKYSLDDFFTLGMYQGDIYKTKNLRNLSLNQMFPDPDDLKQAQDSIDHRLRTFGKDLWVPDREEYLAQKEKEEAEAERRQQMKDNPELGDRDAAVVVGETEDDQVQQKPRNTRSAKKKKNATKRKKSKVKRSSSSSSSEGNSGAAKSVRRRKR